MKLKSKIVTSRPGLPYLIPSKDLFQARSSVKIGESLASVLHETNLDMVLI